MQMTPSLPSPEPNWAWFLDLDGTLFDIASSPMAVVVPDGLVATLTALRSAAHGALAIVSGRPVQQVRDLLQPLRPATAGLHGLELVTPDGLRHDMRIPLPPVGNLRRLLQEAVEQMPGVELENKGPALAVHYRQAPSCEGQVRHVVMDAAKRSRGFDAIEGKMSFELRPANINKGMAVKEFMAIAPFSGRCPVFVGDDRTDEDAFKVVKQMEGIAIRVGTDGETVADWVIESPSALRQWLAEATETLRREAS